MLGPELGFVFSVDAVSTEPDSICVLDDDASVRHSIEQLLDSDGLKAQSFEDAEVFFAYARSHAGLWPCLMCGCQRRTACKCRRGSATYRPIRK
jgi:hypothetical protein